MHVRSDVAAPGPSQRLKVLCNDHPVPRGGSETRDPSNPPHPIRGLCCSRQRTQESKRAKKQDGVTPPHTATSRGGRGRDYHIRTFARTHQERFLGRATPLRNSQKRQYGTAGDCCAIRIAEGVGLQTFISMRMPWRVWSEPLSTRPTGCGAM